jgi:hypothetical protein
VTGSATTNDNTMFAKLLTNVKRGAMFAFDAMLASPLLQYVKPCVVFPRLVLS